MKYRTFYDDYRYALGLRSQAYFETEQFEKAEADLKKASYVPFEKTHSNSQMQWIYYEGLDNYEKKIEACNKLLKHKPGDNEIIVYRSFLYEYLKQNNAAIADYNKIIELHPDSARDYLERAWLYHKKGDYKSALSDCEYAINKRFQLDEAYNMQGQIYLGMKEYKKAIDDFNTAIKFYNWAEPYTYRGDAYRLMGDDKKAMEDYTIAGTLASCSDENRAILEQAKLFEKAGKKDEAIKSYKDFILIASYHNYRKRYEAEKKFAEEKVKALESIS